jgi:hypothetical protein
LEKGTPIRVVSPYIMAGCVGLVLPCAWATFVANSKNKIETSILFDISGEFDFFNF